MRIGFSPNSGKIDGAHARPNSNARLQLRKPTSPRFLFLRMPPQRTTSMSTIQVLAPQGLKCRRQEPELCGSDGVGRTNQRSAALAPIAGRAGNLNHDLPFLATNDLVQFSATAYNPGSSRWSQKSGPWREPPPLPVRTSSRTAIVRIIHGGVPIDTAAFLGCDSRSCTPRDVAEKQPVIP